MKKKIKVRFTIKLKLLVTFILLAIIPVITLGTISYFNAIKTVDTQISQTAAESIEILDDAITNLVQQKVADAEYFAEILSKENSSSQEGSDLRKRLNEYAALHPENHSIYLGTASGEMIQYPKKELPSGYDPRERDWYKDAINQSDVVISDAYQSSSGDNVVTISKKLKDGSGVIGINVKIDSLNTVTQKMTIGKEGYAILLGREKAYISHPTVKPGVVPTEPFIEKLYEKDSGQFNYDYEGDSKKMLFTTNKLTDWKVAGTIFNKEANEGASSIVTAIVIIEILAVVIGVFVAILVTRSITKPLNSLKNSAEVISKGDLTNDIAVKSNNELGELGHAFNSMKENLRELILQVDMNTEQVAASAEELSAASEETTTTTVYVGQSIQEMANGAQSQMTGMKQTADAMTSIVDKMAKISVHIDEVTEEAKKTEEHAEVGGVSVQQTVDQMQTISTYVNESDAIIQTLYSRSKEIDEIINVISGIAEQTNLLALNAAIEAARAGEQGKGFAVVAEEVRRLAEQSQQSAKQITTLIQDIQVNTKQSVEKMSQAAGSVEAGIQISTETITKFEEILKGVRKIGPQLNEVTNVSEFVSKEVQLVSQTTNKLADIARDNATSSDSIAASTQEQIASLEEVNLSAKSLAKMSEELQTLLRQFSV